MTTHYSKAIAEEICQLIASNGVSLTKICKDNPHIPSRDVIFRWIAKNKEFADMYSRAKICQVEVLVDDILDISDDSSRDEMDQLDQYGDRRMNYEFVQRSRLRVDSRKWQASKLARKVYGEKVTNEITGKDGENLFGDMSEDDRNARVDALFNEARERRAAETVGDQREGTE